MTFTPFASWAWPGSRERTMLSPFEGWDIRRLIDSQARAQDTRPCMIWVPFDGTTEHWTYAQFGHVIRRFAAGLVARGVAAGDRVIVHMHNCPEMVIAWLGAAYAGAVPVTTNPAASADEIAYFTTHSGAVGVVTDLDHAILFEGLPVKWIASTGDPGVLFAGIKPFDWLGGDPSQLPARPCDPAAPFGIQYTSGTTARPKAVLWTHANALWGARVSAAHEALVPRDVHLVHMPLFHTNAQVYSVLATLWAGASFVLQPRFSASRFWPVSLAHKCTWTSVIPFCVKALMAHPVPEVHSYRNWGNALCDPPTDEHFKVKTVGWWGMTETITHGTIGSVALPDASMSCGRPSPSYRLHLLNPNGEPVGPGETGDLFVEGIPGISLFAGYFGNETATREAFTAEGLFITGDRMRLGEDGYLYFADRNKDMLKVAGENVAASEVERVIQTVEGVAEVAVVGKPHQMRGEVPVAFVVAVGSPPLGLEEQIIAACGRMLSPFKVPAEVRLVETLPRGTLNKIAKAQLRAQLVSESNGAI